MLLLKVLLLSIAVLQQCSCDDRWLVGYPDGSFEDLILQNGDDPQWIQLIRDAVSTMYTSPNGHKFYQIDAEEVAIMARSSPEKSFLSCHRFESNHQCSTTYMPWHTLKEKVIFSELESYEKLLKVDMVLIDKHFHDIAPRPVFFLMDWIHYGWPVSTYVTTYPHMVFKFVVDTSSLNHLDSKLTTYVLYLHDRRDHCKAYRPKGTMTGADTMSTALYVNMIHGKNRTYQAPAYFFIKKEGNICIYKFPVNKFMGDNEIDVDIFPKEGFFLKNYPTEGYAPKFFAFDPLYGTFVSLYWNKVCGSHPEAHFFVFNENDPRKTQLVDKFTLTDFDQHILEDIFAERYTAEAYPVFTSWGRQIYFSFTKSEGKTDSILWKNEKEYLKMYTAFRGVFRARKDYVQHWSPANYNADKPHDNVRSSSTQAPFTHCLPATTTTTTTEAPTTSTTMKSTTTTVKKSAIPEGGHGKRAAQDDQNVKDAGGFGNQ